MSGSDDAEGIPFLNKKARRSVKRGSIQILELNDGMLRTCIKAFWLRYLPFYHETREPQNAAEALDPKRGKT